MLKIVFFSLNRLDNLNCIAKYHLILVLAHFAFVHDICDLALFLFAFKLIFIFFVYNLDIHNLTNDLNCVKRYLSASKKNEKSNLNIS